MADNVSLQEIRLSRNEGIGQAGWQSLFEALSILSYRFEKHMLEKNKINDAAAQSLSNALASSTTLKTLNLGDIQGIITWRVSFDSIRSPTYALEELDLRDNDFNDEVMDYLTDALAKNNSLRTLDLNGNAGVTGATWQIFFSTVLTNPSLGLEKLVLGFCGINDAAIRALINALGNNNK